MEFNGKGTNSICTPIIKHFQTIFCKIFHKESLEITYYDVQEHCYTASCNICGRKEYIGGGNLQPTGFKFTVNTQPEAMNFLTAEEFKMIVDINGGE